MADDKIVISAIARVVDLATGPLKAIQRAITGVSEVAAKTGNAVSGMGGKVSGAMAGMSGRIGAATSKIGAFARNVGGMITPLRGLIGLAGIGGVTVAMTNFISKSKEIAAASTRLGVSTDMVQVFANVFGDSTERATDAMSQLQKTLAKMRAGGKGIADTTKLFAKMGVTAQQIAKGDLGEILPTIMESFKKTKDPVLRTAMALKIFGKAGQELIPFLTKGKEGFADAVDEMVKMGIVSEDIATGLKAGSALKEFGNVVESVSNTMVAQFLPAVTGIVKSISTWVKNNKDLLKQVALPTFIGAVATAVIALGIAVAGALGPWGLLAAAIAAAATAIYQNWDPIIKWIDEQVPGLSTTLTQAGNDIVAWVKKSSAAISKGFEEEGLVGGVKAYVVAVKDAWSGIGGWMEEQLRKINWSAVGSWAGAQLYQALIGVMKIEQQLGQVIIDQFTAALAKARQTDWGSAGQDAGTKMGNAFMAAWDAVWAFDKWTSELGVKLTASMNKVDWGKLIKDFFQLDAELSRMAEQWVDGMITGMLNAIPGFKKAKDAIKDILNFGESVFGPNPEFPPRLGAQPVTPSGPMSPMPGTPTARLLELGKPQAERSEVTIKNTVVLPNGGTVQTESSSMGPVNVKNLGQSQTVAP